MAPGGDPAASPDAKDNTLNKPIALDITGTLASSLADKPKVPDGIKSDKDLYISSRGSDGSYESDGECAGDGSRQRA